MAQPILLETPPRDPRAELRSRLESAPIDHAEALLAGLDLLQKLHDGGTLDLLRGAAGSRDKVIDVAAKTATAPDSIRGMRNLIVLLNTLGAVDPEALAAHLRSIPAVLKAVTPAQPKPPSLWQLIKGFLFDHDVRRGHLALISLLRAFGKDMAENEPRG